MSRHPRNHAPQERPESERAREQVERILGSDTLRASEVLRRLLRFLADKTFSGEADHLKEYSVGLDALGKPPSYDPRQDAAVRLQASRLRLKLDKYYQNEGKDDPLTVEIPRGRFKIAWSVRGEATSTIDSAAFPVDAVAPELPDLDAHSAGVKKWRNLAASLAALSLILAGLHIWTLVESWRTASANSALPPSSPELNALWSPFLLPRHHLIVAFSNPLFIRFQKSGSPDIVYRRRQTSTWDEAIASPEFSVLSRSLGNPSAKPSFNFVERSNVVSIFVLSQFLARRRGDISLERLSDLSWQQFADNDVFLLATPPSIDERQSGLPVKLAYASGRDGVRTLLPLAGEPLLYADAEDHQESDGNGLELVSALPGPLGRTMVLSFAGTHAWGMIGCVQALTDPAFARTVVQKLRKPSGELPRYYQLIVRVGYRDGTATNASYVAHRVLKLMPNSADGQN